MVFSPFCPLRRLYCFVVCLLLGGVASPSFAGESRSAFDSLVKAYNAAAVEELFPLLDVEMQKVLPRPAIKQFFDQMHEKYGQIERSVKASAEGGWQVYDLQGKKQSFSLKIATNDRGQITGLLLLPAQSVAARAIELLVKSYNEGSAGDLYRLMSAQFRKQIKLNELKIMLQMQKEKHGRILKWDQVKAEDRSRSYWINAEKRPFQVAIEVNLLDEKIGDLRFIRVPDRRVIRDLLKDLPNGPTDLAAIQKQLAAAVERVREEYHYPSISLALVKGERIVWADAFGYLNVAKQVKADDKTVYLTGSISKVLVATAVMQLVDEKKIELDAPINQYLKTLQIPNPFDKEAPLTTRHLLTHRSGLSTYDGKDVPIAWRVLPPSLEETVRTRAIVERRPGTAQRYSNLGFTVNGYLISQLCGQSFEKAMQELLFAPLQMSRTSYELAPAFTENLALPYTNSRDGESVEVTHAIRSDVYPAGNAYSTPSDMARFLIMHLNEGRYHGRQVLSAAAVNEMARLQTNGADSPVRFGLGWAIDSIKSRRLLWHNGAALGFMTYMRIDPERKIGVVLFANKCDVKDDIHFDPLPDLAHLALKLLNRWEEHAATVKP